MLQIDSNVSRNRLWYNLMGLVLITVCLQLFLTVTGVSPRTFPGPINVFLALHDFVFVYDASSNFLYSLFINSLGYTEAVLIAVPLAYCLAVNDKLYYMVSPILNVSRYIPLLLMIGAFMLWFGLSTLMKVEFLALAIFVYLLPACVENIRTLDPIYIQTAKTSGATKWQIFRHVIIPGTAASVCGSVFMLIAISWTYTNAVEVINSEQGGIGALAAAARRDTRLDVVYAAILSIAVFGFIQDWLSQKVKEWLFPYLHKGEK